MIFEEEAGALASELRDVGTIIFPLEIAETHTCYIVSISTLYSKIGVFPWGGQCRPGDDAIISLAGRGMFWFSTANDIHPSYYAEKLGITCDPTLAECINMIFKYWRESK